MQDDEIDNIDDDLDNIDSDFDSGIDPFGDFGASTNIQKHSDLLKELTNFDPIIKARIRTWLGLEWDTDTKDYVQKQEAIINEKGARWAVGFLQTYQAKTNIITNINEHEFKNLQKDLIQMAWLVFPTIEDFGVTSTANWYRLCQELEHSAFLVLAGAGDGKYTKFLGESVQRTESVQLNQREQQGALQPSPTQNPAKNWWSTTKNKLLGRA